MHLFTLKVIEFTGAVAFICIVVTAFMDLFQMPELYISISITIYSLCLFIISVLTHAEYEFMKDRELSEPCDAYCFCVAFIIWAMIILSILIGCSI